MPNLIEQQDLLKGLPDARLALLLQNPVGDIPPFLVAAEAQRRQAIRQQFAGADTKESVVDSLSRQLAPKGINAPAQMTPPVPPTPEMQGVAALQQQQAMQQAAMAAQGQQQMSGGGPVRRFAGEGYVKPQPLIKYPNYGPQVYDWVSNAGSAISNAGKGFWDWATTPYSEMEDPPPEETKAEFPKTTLSQVDDQSELAAQKRRMNANTAPVDPGKKDTSVANQSADQPVKKPDETDAEFRARLAKLYDYEPSDWEKAKRWFAMSEQFLDPTKTTMQSIAGAGMAFADASADMNAAERQAKIEKEKALLMYDKDERDYQRSQAASQAETQREAYKFYATQTASNAQAAAEANKQLARELNDYIKTTYPSDGLEPIDPAKIAADPNVVEIKRQMADNQKLISGYVAQNAGALGNYGRLTGTDPSVEIFLDGNLTRIGGR